MSALDPLVPVAVVGTARRDLDSTALPVGPGSADLSALPPARALLVLAARAALADRVALPAGAPGADPGPEPETVPAPSSPFFAGTLNQAIGGDRWRVVGESLRHLAATGQRLPVGVIHRLLLAAETRSDLRRDLAPVLGSRGRWLAACNPRWEFGEWLRPDPDDDEPWQTGTRAERLAWLAAVRAVDPARARSLLAEGLSEEDAAGRAAHLEVLRTGLGPDDEPVLEGALDDRGRDVRAIARDLLALLPESGFVGRMRERIRARVEIRHERWSVELAGLGPADERDGLRLPARGRVPGAEAVRALTGGVPLEIWPEDLGLSAVELVRLRDGRLELGPLPGLRDAAVREHDPLVAQEILYDQRWPADPALVAQLDPTIVDHVLARRVRMLEPPDAVAELRVQGFGRETAAALLAWVLDTRSHGRRSTVLTALGDHGPLDDGGDLAFELRQQAARLLAGDRARALDAAMTINLRRALRAEAQPAQDPAAQPEAPSDVTPPLPRPARADQEHP